MELRAWAPCAEQVHVRVAGADHELADEGFGVRAARVEAAPGDDYWLVLDGQRLPDPCSRWQPEGIRGPSRVLATAFARLGGPVWRPPGGGPPPPGGPDPGRG